MDKNKKENFDWMDDPDEFVLWTNEGINGGIINTQEIALKFAQMILENGKAAADVMSQLPLRIEDKGDAWFVQGSLNPDLSLPGLGPWQIQFRKRDAKIVFLRQEISMAVVQNKSE